jgi:serine/threonine-protein kinase
MNTERNLLFGVLALQAGLIDDRQLAEAGADWIAHKEASLADILIRRGLLTPADQEHLDYLLERKIKKHAGDVRAGLATVATVSARRSLGALEDSDVQNSLANLELPPCVDAARPEQRLQGLFDPGTTLERGGGPTPDSTPCGNESRYGRLRLHAAGGIGQVWLAEDHDLGRQVALKELKPETAPFPAMVTRFLDEARITGQLEHPGIVPVYELVQGSGDRPAFYTMRFIKGRTLSHAIADYHRKRATGEARPLDLAALLNAFVGVCNAVAYAHSRGVVHRDLKGQNVVLGDFGEVIVLDWGLAKLVGRPEAAGDSPPVVLDDGRERDQTLQGQVLGTPVYMAPEQAAGRLDLIDQRTDVYGLGAILYEILTGRPPVKLACPPAPGNPPTRLETLEMLRQIIQDEPVRPRQVNADVPRPLEAVCLRALAKKPQDRYPSAGELAREVQRWLADEPVTAYREPLVRRAARWARRHQAVAAGLGALLCTALVALSVSTWLVGRAQARTAKERDRANREKEQKQQALEKSEKHYRYALDAVDRYYTQVSEDPRLKVRLDLRKLRRKLLGTARDFYRQFLKDRRDDPTLEARLSETQSRLAIILGDIGPQREALRFLQDSRKALAKLARANPRHTPYRHNLAATDHNLGMVFLKLGSWDRAEHAFRRALALKRQLVKDKPRDPSSQMELANTYNSLGNLELARGRPDRARRELGRALAIQQRLVAGRHPQDAAYLLALAMGHGNLARVERQRRRFKEARDHHAQAVRLLVQLVRKHPGTPEYRQKLAKEYTNFGIFYERTNQPVRKADQVFRWAVAGFGRLTRRYPDVAEYLAGLAWAYRSWAYLYFRHRQMDRGYGYFRSYLEAQEKLLSGQGGQLSPRVEFASGVALVATNLLRHGQYHRALGLLDRAYVWLEGLRPQVQSDPKARAALRKVHELRGSVFQFTSSQPLYAGELESALRLADGKEGRPLKLKLAEALSVLGESERAERLARELALSPKVTGNELYTLSLVYFNLCHKALIKSNPPLKDPLVQKYAGECVRFLSWVAAVGGFKDPVKMRFLLALEKYTPIGSRADFKKLLKKVRGKR